MILIILADSVMTYMNIKQTLDLSKFSTDADSKHIDNFEMIKKSQYDDYLIVYKRYR